MADLSLVPRDIRHIVLTECQMTPQALTSVLKCTRALESLIYTYGRMAVSLSKLVLTATIDRTID